MKINNNYGHVHISSKSQELNFSIEHQKQQLIQNGMKEKHLFVEIESKSTNIKNQSIFKKLINQKLKENDLLIVTKIN